MQKKFQIKSIVSSYRHCKIIKQKKQSNYLVIKLVTLTLFFLQPLFEEATLMLLKIKISLKNLIKRCLLLQRKFNTVLLLSYYWS